MANVPGGGSNNEIEQLWANHKYHQQCDIYGQAELLALRNF